MRLLANLAVLACPLALAALAAGCGSGGGSSSTASTPAGPRAKNVPAPPMSAFPAAAGKTLGEITKGGTHSQYGVEAQAMAFYEGPNRFPFEVFEREGHVPANDVEVALYFAKVPKLHPKNGKLKKGIQAQARLRAMEEPAHGPFPASIESLETKPGFRQAAAASGPEAARAVYSSSVDFPVGGDWRAAAVFREGDGYGVAVLPDVVVGEFHRIPRPGQPAPLIHTPTNGQNQVDYADALGKEPIFLLFTDPQFCQSRVCGPVLDTANQVKQTYGDKAAFIHMRIYSENDPEKGPRPQVEAFHLPSEPWLFAIDRQGIVVDAIEGAVGVGEMTRVAKQVTSE